MPDRTGSPEKRVRKQARQLEGSLRKTIKALDTHYPDTHKCDEILSQHQQLVTKILIGKRKPPSPLEPCPGCGKLIPKRAKHWTEFGIVQFFWSCFVLGLTLGIGFLWGWWALLVPVVAVAVTLPFWWSIVVPTLLLLGVIFIFDLFGL
jgi:hypothetical protein